MVERALVVAAHVAQGAREQLELAQRHALVEAAVDPVHVDAGGDELGGHDVGGGAGVLVHEAPGVGDQPDVERVGDRRGGLHAQAAHEIPDDLRGARGGGDDVVDRAEVGVVVVVVDVEDVRPVALEPLGGVAVDVAAVQEDDRPVVEVLRRLGDQPLQRDEAVLIGKRGARRRPCR